MCAVVHRDARVVKDMATGKSKGYGFVSFFNKWVSLMMKRQILMESPDTSHSYCCCSHSV